VVCLLKTNDLCDGALPVLTGTFLAPCCALTEKTVQNNNKNGNCNFMCDLFTIVKDNKKTTS
jgi:hypothetical protein